MAQPIAADYGQQFLFPPALEDWVGPDHPVRFLREFVDQLDLPALGFVIPAAVEGRPPYHPNLLLKIWLYGYFQRIRATRKLEAACTDHLPLKWLCGLQAPDHNSLWRFWRDNKKALREVFKQTVRVALDTGAVGLALQALDGTKIPAAGSDESCRTKAHLEKLLAALDRAVEQTELQVMAESAEFNEPGPRLPPGLAQRQALRQQIQQALSQLAADGRRHHHRVEPEARVMKVRDLHRPAYNAQAVADAQAGIIVACDVSRQESDSGALVPMLEQARDNLDAAAVAAPPLTVADSGYGTAADLAAAQEKNLPVLIPPREGKPPGDNAYASIHFRYDAAQRTVTCPRGVRLDYEGHTMQAGQRVERYRCHCADCPVRAQCTNDPKGRRIEIRPHAGLVQAMRDRLRDPVQRAVWEQRGRIIEPRFGQLKQHDGFRRWTVWGLESVRTQWSMLCATLNLRVLYRRWRRERGPGPKVAVQWPSGPWSSLLGLVCPRTSLFIQWAVSKVTRPSPTASVIP